jgi:MSHA biogenesis protein MshK
MREVIFLSLAMLFGSACAQPMNDPMRPPSATGQEAAGASGPAAAGLQAVIISPERKVAIIDGEVVPLGAQTRHGTLSGLSDSSAVVNKKSERDVLLMHPHIEKRPARRSEAK